MGSLNPGVSLTPLAVTVQCPSASTWHKPTFTLNRNSCSPKLRSQCYDSIPLSLYHDWPECRRLDGRRELIRYLLKDPLCLPPPPILLSLPLSPSSPPHLSLPPFLLPSLLFLLFPFNPITSFSTLSFCSQLHLPSRQVVRGLSCFLVRILQRSRSNGSARGIESR